MGYLNVCLISASSSILITLFVYLYNLITKEKKVNNGDYIKIFIISLIVVSILSGVILETSLVESIQSSISSKSEVPAKSGGHKIKTISVETQHIDTSPPNF